MISMNGVSDIGSCHALLTLAIVTDEKGQGIVVRDGPKLHGKAAEEKILTLISPFSGVAPTAWTKGLRCRNPPMTG